MKKQEHKTKLEVGIILGILFFLLLLPVRVKAADFVEVTLGDNNSAATYHTLQEIFNDKSLSGNISVKLLTNSESKVTGDNDRIIIPDRFTTLKITSDEARVLMINEYHSSEKYQALFANGKNLIIDSNITVRAHETFGSVTIYGGNINKDIKSAGTITINGTQIGTIYGGGYNSSVTGNPTIIVNGSAGTIYGGGFASTGLYVEPLEATANVNGNITIKVSETGTVNNIYGGGSAICKNTNQILTFKNTANVVGDIKIIMDGSNQTIYGGGRAGDSYAVEYFGYEATANVTGNIAIIYGPTGKHRNSSSYLEVWGGGTATSNPKHDNKVNANVYGSISIDATQDDTATTSQPNSKTFSRFFGGGQAYGSSAFANVSKNVTIKTSRPCFESSFGLVGGGYALVGGTANVEGTVRIKAQPIPNQIAKYANISTIIGGGYTAGPATDLVTTANVGNTKIEIASGTYHDPSSVYGVAIQGGGHAALANSHAEVLNDVTMIIGDNKGKTTIGEKIYGGGLAQKELTNTDIRGDVNITYNNLINEKQYTYGGGYAYGNNTTAEVKGTVNFTIDHNSVLKYSSFGGGNATGENSSANVNNINMTLNNNSFITNNAIFGGGYATKATATADANNINLTIANGSKPGSNLNTSYYIYGGGRTTNGASAKAKGNTTITLDNVEINHYLTSKGSGDNTLPLGKTNFISKNNSKIEGIYDTNNVTIKQGSTLTVTTTAYAPFTAQTLSVEPAGELIVYNAPNISGDFYGGGTITLPATEKLVIGGYAYNSTILNLVGDVNFDTIYAQAKKNSSGDFIYKNNEVVLEKAKATDESNDIWKLRKSSAENDLVAFDFQNITTTVNINQIDKKILVTVPYKTNISNLIANFKVSDNATVKIAEKTQVSGKTENDFTNAVIYKVIAENGDIKEYEVKVEVAAKPSNSAVIDINQAGDKTISFQVNGTGMNNNSPKQGDLRWNPVKWWLNKDDVIHKVSGNNSILPTDLKVGTNTLYIAYQLQRYNGVDWVDIEGDTEIKTETFVIEESANIPNTRSTDTTWKILLVITLIIGVTLIIYEYKSKNKKSIRYLGRTLSALSIALLLTTAFQNQVTAHQEEKKLDTYFEQIAISQNTTEKSIEMQTKTDYIAAIEIPSINLKKGLVSPTSKENTVEKNVQIIEGSTMPDVENGNLILAGHSGTGAKAHFKDLHKLQKKDAIKVYYNESVYEYQVTQIYEMDKVGKINTYHRENATILTLTTCSENSNKQTIIVAELTKKSNV